MKNRNETSNGSHLDPHEIALNSSDDEDSIKEEPLDEDSPVRESKDETSPDAEGEIKVEPDKKGKKKKKGKGTKTRSKIPTDEEMLTRLNEKNQVIFKLNEKYSEIESKAKDFQDKWLRSVAELENYRKRTRKEWELLMQKTKAEVILEVLNVVDDFERAFSAVDQKDDDDFFQGVTLIYSNLVAVLEKFGVKPVEAIGKPFDPNYHMAIAQVESKDAEQNHVIEVIQKGYLLDESVIRPAKVVIAK